MKKIKTVARIVVIVLVSLVVGVNLYSWNARSLMGNALPMPMGYGAAVVLTGSMEPTIMADDLIIVAEQEDYAEDDVVVYQSGSILVVHRIVDITDGMVTTQGDANSAADEPVEMTAIKGKVIAIIPVLGNLARLLKTPAATIVLLAGAVLMLEASFRKEKQKNKRVYHTRYGSSASVFNVRRSSCDRACRGDSTKHSRAYVTKSLRYKLGIGIVLVVYHIVGHDAGEQGFYCREQRDRNSVGNDCDYRIRVE